MAGWLEGTGLKAVEVARRVKEAGVTLVEYTDVARDGMFTGVDAAGAAALQAEAGIPVVASGGVASLDDVEACRDRRAGRRHRRQGALRGAARSSPTRWRAARAG